MTKLALFERDISAILQNIIRKTAHMKFINLDEAVDVTVSALKTEGYQVEVEEIKTGEKFFPSDSEILGNVQVERRITVSDNEYSVIIDAGLYREMLIFAKKKPFLK
jgi:hypothetical protein